MKIYLKIGTMPVLEYHLCHRHKLPKLGAHIRVKTENSRCIKAENIVIDGIKEDSIRPLYYGYRM